MFRGALVLESVFEDHGVCSEVITDLFSPLIEQFMSGVPWFSHFHQPCSWLAGERVLVSCPTLLPFLPSHRTPAGLLFKSWNWYTLWSDSDAEVIELNDILALAAAVHMFINLNRPLPQQRYSRRLPELLTAVVELLTRHQPNGVTALFTVRTIQQVTRAECHVTFWKSWSLSLQR